MSGEVLPGSGGARHVGLSAQSSFDADFARDVGDLVGEDRERIGHVVDGFTQRRHLALGFDRQLLSQISVRHGRDHFHDAADLVRQIGGHDVDGVGEVLPGTGHALHDRLTAKLSFRPDLARHTGDLGRERVELVDHGINGVLQLENFAFDVDRDLARQVAAGDGRRDFGDVSHLRGEVGAHRVDRVGEVLPRAGDARHDRLHAQPAFGPDLARHARDLRRERPQLLDHRVDGFLQLQNFAADVDRDLARQVAVGHGDRHLGDVAHLRGQVRRHRVHVVGQVLPGSRDTGHDRLAAELAFRPDLARDARDFRRERA